ncbi:DUF928 domain-containing protein [Leptolyngbya sp. FACHB-36]|uniref:DUF928 domain-containing protein n=1 Tax=Leptolyngbya sp. FACHB-36 TaxID=2692808 RepID=UPI001680757F|nr:DUF928 domain-containing protein [Leptolyngbya sp. FACHB-36]MBD2020727.1 DUF928 domain-containing protein [Leptolyngbya sp. FACHB-36]
MALAPSALGIQAQRQVLPREGRTQQISDLPPPPQNPKRTTGGGRRDGGSCPQDAKTATQSLTALSPEIEPGSTLSDYPTFFVSVPTTSAKTAEFSLFDQTRRGIYQTTFTLTGTPSIVRFTLPSNAPPLAVGQTYTWAFALICEPNNRRRDRLTTGWIRRIQLAPAQLRQITQAVAKERVLLYRKVGIWYETLSAVIELQRAQPTDPTLEVAWKDLLQSGGLNPTAIQPLRK